MYIAQEYAVQSGSQYNPTQFNTSMLAAISVAVENAQSIVESSTGTLLERLVGYKEKICELTSYNTAAVNNGWPYGNPWQLVWVFDGDASTKVVCEGYSKAFKYLCDLSNFNNAECLLVSGTMSGGTGAGAHMWNVMKMDDGRNYLVDVTNCDNGTIGYPNKLFMAYGPGGSYDDGYIFPTGSADMKYTYDDDTKALYSPSALTISPTAYEPGSTGITDLSSDGKTPIPASLHQLRASSEGYLYCPHERPDKTQGGGEIDEDNKKSREKIWRERSFYIHLQAIIISLSQNKEKSSNKK